MIVDLDDNMLAMAGEHGEMLEEFVKLVNGSSKISEVSAVYL